MLGMRCSLTRSCGSELYGMRCAALASFAFVVHAVHCTTDWGAFKLVVEVDMSCRCVSKLLEYNARTARLSCYRQRPQTSPMQSRSLMACKSKLAIALRVRANLRLPYVSSAVASSLTSDLSEAT
jgi:hypothetical protein